MAAPDTTQVTLSNPPLLAGGGRQQLLYSVMQHLMNSQPVCEKCTQKIGREVLQKRISTWVQLPLVLPVFFCSQQVASFKRFLSDTIQALVLLHIRCLAACQ